MLNWEFPETDIDLRVSVIDPDLKVVKCIVSYTHKKCGNVTLDTDVRVSLRQP